MQSLNNSTPRAFKLGVLLQPEMLALIGRYSYLLHSLVVVQDAHSLYNVAAAEKGSLSVLKSSWDYFSS